MPRLLKKGQGWRLGWHPEAEKYKALVGNDAWAIELTAAEFRELYRLLTQVRESMQQIATELMDSERIAIAAESEMMWLEAEGFPEYYSLRLILHQERRCEVNWDEGVIPDSCHRVVIGIRTVVTNGYNADCYTLDVYPAPNLSLKVDSGSTLTVHANGNN